MRVCLINILSHLSGLAPENTSTIVVVAAVNNGHATPKVPPHQLNAQYKLDHPQIVHGISPVAAA